MGFTAVSSIFSGGRINTPIDASLESPERAKFIEGNGLRDKFEDFAERAAGHDATGRGAHLAHMQEVENVQNAEADIARLRADVRDNGGTANADRIPVLESKLADLRLRRDRVEGLAQPAFRARDVELAVAKRCVELVDHLTSTGAKVRPATVKPLGNTPDAAARATAAVQVKLDQRHDIERAPLTFDSALAAISAEVEAEAVKGIKVVVGVDGRPHIRWPLERVYALAESSVLPTVVDAAALAASLFPDALIAKAKAELETIYRDVPLALDPLEKRKALEAIDQEILAAEYVEAATTWAARAAGHNVPWRKDVSATAVLGISA